MLFDFFEIVGLGVFLAVVAILSTWWFVLLSAVHLPNNCLLSCASLTCTIDSVYLDDQCCSNLKFAPTSCSLKRSFRSKFATVTGGPVNSCSFEFCFGFIDAHCFIVTCLPISRQLRIFIVVAIHSSAFQTLLHCSAESKPARFSFEFYFGFIDVHCLIVTCLPISRQLRISIVVAIHPSPFQTLLHCSAESKPACFK